jgi:putative N6-adenine-specific DNA methylase
VWLGYHFAEAAMIACNIPANINRREFAFEKWNDWDNDLFDKIVDSLLSKVREFHYTIKGYDKAPSAVLKSKTTSAMPTWRNTSRCRNAIFSTPKRKLRDRSTCF